MSIQTSTVLKSYFNLGDKPTEAQFADLIDTALASNIRTVKYRVGVPGITGCNHNFTSVANTTEQGVQLGGTTIIPGKCNLIQNIIHCVVGLNTGTATTRLGTSSGGSEYGSGAVDTTDEITRVATTAISASATSVYFSVTPSANWNTLTTGTWDIYITYVDNSNL
jgi:hypothetical protein